jgi:hypothetical protein
MKLFFDQPITSMKVENINSKDLLTSKAYNDTPEHLVVFFQDNATPQMEGLEELHNNIMYYLAIILFAVS